MLDSQLMLSTDPIYDIIEKGHVKYRVKALYVIINFVINSVGPPRTLDSVSISVLRCAVAHLLCT